MKWKGKKETQMKEKKERDIKQKIRKKETPSEKKETLKRRNCFILKGINIGS